MGKLALFPLIFLFTMNSVLAATQDYSAIIDKQAQQIKNLTSRLESLENTVFDLKNQLKSGDRTGAVPAPAELTNTPAPTSVNSAEVPATTPPAANPGEVLSATEKSAVSQDKKDYDTALAALKDNKFEQAEVLFSEFIEKYPNSNLQSNAIFWYAETFFRRSEFNKSAINYLKGYKAFPKGSKAADSLLKLSFSLASLNKKQEACNMLDKLEAEFPNRPATSIKRAKEARSKFGCK
jgi:tol-pal system protein YbgF